MTDLIKHDPLVASNFWLELDGALVSLLSEVSGLDLEIEVVEMKQTSQNGVYAGFKAMGQVKMAGELTIKRMAPLDIDNDPLWKWFNDLREKGMVTKSRADKRKNGSVVVYDASNAEVARWNFFNAWPSKISSDSFSATSTEAVSETITLVMEKLVRKK
jgi:phage tail-like protein